MGSIKATFSAVNAYADDCCGNYTAMINTANEILDRVEKMYAEVQADYEKISKQIIRLQIMCDEVSSKAKSYEYEMNMAKNEADDQQAVIDYLYNNPDTITSTDEDGNETTEVVYDYAAIHEAERKKSEALEVYDFYREKYEFAYSVLCEVTSTQGRFETIRNAIFAVSESIQSDMYEIKKYISAIGDESEFNSQSLQGVIEKLSSYLASKAFFMPIGAHYEDFASSGSGDYVSVESANSSVDDISISNIESEVSVDKDVFNEVSLGLEDLTDTELSVDDLPDKTELISYKEINSAKDYSDRKYIRQSQRALQSLDWESQKAFRNYSNEGYIQINSYLRGKPQNFVSDSQKEYIDKSIESMTKAIDNQTLPHNMKLYRGISNPGVIFGTGWESKSLQELRSEYVGQVFMEKGFCSTTISRDAAEDFTRTCNGTMLEITAPKGANGIFMEEVSVFKQEKEVLLQKGSGFKITGIDYDTYSGYIIRTQLIGRR